MSFCVLLCLFKVSDERLVCELTPIDKIPKKSGAIGLKSGEMRKLRFY